VVHSLGVAGIALNTKATLGQAFLSDLVFYPGDIIKNILAAVIAVALHRAFPDILVRRVRRTTVKTTAKTQTTKA
jgi:biotin transport system substrate-specific component